jgi:hypothetical protein
MSDVKKNSIEHRERNGKTWIANLNGGLEIASVMRCHLNKLKVLRRSFRQ